MNSASSVVLSLPSPELSKGEVPTPEQVELKLVQSKRDIESPPPISSISLPV